MADLLARFGLDDSAFRKGLRELEGAVEGAGRRVEASSNRVGDTISRALRIGVSVSTLRKGFKFAQEAVREYTQENEFAARMMGNLQGSIDRLQASIGRDLVLAFGSATRSAAGFLATLDRIRTGGVNLLAGLLGADTASIDASMTELERLDRELRQARGAEALERRIGGQFLGASPLLGGLLREKELHEENKRLIREQAAELGLAGDQVSRLVALEQSRHASNMAFLREQEAERRRAEQAREDEARRRALDDEEREAKRHRDAVIGVEQDLKRLEIQGLRERGDRRGAERAQRELDLEQRILAINDSALSREEKIGAIRRTRAAFARLGLEEAGPLPTRTVGLEAGLGNTAIAAQVLGPLRGTESRRQTTLLEQSNRHLAAIARNTAQGATYQ